MSEVVQKGKGNRRGNPRPKGTHMWIKVTHPALGGMLLGKLTLNKMDGAITKKAVMQKIVQRLRLEECVQYKEKRKEGALLD